MNALKKFLFTILILSLAFSIAACTQNTGSSSDSKAEDTVTITDHLGKEVTVAKNAERIVVCDIFPLPSVLTVFFDSAEKIVGMSENSMSAAANGLLKDLYPEILNAETGFMKGSQVNLEELMKLNPDVVFYSASNPALGEQLTNAGMSAVAISANDWNYNAIETLEQWIALLSKIFPDNDKTEAVSKYSKEVYELISDRVSSISQEERERVFFVFKYSESDLLTSGCNFFGQWWADAIGAVNVCSELTQDNQISVNMEQVYSWNPSMIFITNFTPAYPDDLYSNTIGNYNWSGVDAVKNKKVYKMPLGMYRSYTPGVDTPITLLWFAKTTYPQLFEDVNITDYTIEYYKEVFGVTLTAEQADSIFKPSQKVGEGF